MVLFLPQMAQGIEFLSPESKSCPLLFQSLKEKNYEKAYGLRSGNCPTLSHLSWMFYLKEGKSKNLKEYEEFLRTHPDWPGKHYIHKKGQQAISGKEPSSLIFSFFALYPPSNYKSAIVYIQALDSLKKKDLKAKTISSLWRQGLFSSQEEVLFLQKFKGFLKRDDYVKRMDFFINQDDMEGSKRQLAYLTPAEEKRARLRMALRRKKDDKVIQLKGYLKNLKEDYDLLADYVRYERLKGHDEQAQKAILTIKNHGHDGLWREQHILARDAITRGDGQKALLLIENPGLKPGTADYADGQWLKGWILLRILGRAEEALKNFQLMSTHVRKPMSMARALYWCGRGAEQCGKSSMAKLFFEKAASYPATFYGQEAIFRMNGSLEKTLRQQLMRPQIRDVFEKHTLVLAMKELVALGMTDLLNQFSLSALKHFHDQRDFSALMWFLNQHAPHQVVLTQLSSPFSQGCVMKELYPQLKKSVPCETDRALVHSVIRRESGFYTGLISPAGAMGLMQVMPDTAKRLCEKLKIPYHKKRLLRDDRYNVRLGSYYLKKLLHEYNSHLPLVLAGYNAGPHRVTKWIADHGDPRFKDVDLIDWIEKIPYGETRNYVQRVIENYHVYRHLHGL